MTSTKKGEVERFFLCTSSLPFLAFETYDHNFFGGEEEAERLFEKVETAFLFFSV